MVRAGLTRQRRRRDMEVTKVFSTASEKGQHSLHLSEGVCGQEKAGNGFDFTDAKWK